MSEILGDSSRITYDSNGVPRIRDTGIAVWQIASHLTDPAGVLPTTFSQLTEDDFTAAAAFRITELEALVRKLTHDAVSQINAIVGFTDMAHRGMIEQEEACDLLATPLRNNAHTILGLLLHTGRVLNGTTDLYADAGAYQFPMRVSSFIYDFLQTLKQNNPLEVTIQGDNTLPDHLYVTSDDGLQTALVELVRQRYFARSFEHGCEVKFVIQSPDSAPSLQIICERRLKGDILPSFLTDWTLSPVPVAAYILEQRGGRLTHVLNGSTIHFEVIIPLHAQSSGG